MAAADLGLHRLHPPTPYGPNKCQRSNQIDHDEIKSSDDDQTNQIKCISRFLVDCSWKEV